MHIQMCICNPPAAGALAPAAAQLTRCMCSTCRVRVFTDPYLYAAI